MNQTIFPVRHFVSKMCRSGESGGHTVHQLSFRIQMYGVVQARQGDHRKWGDKHLCKIQDQMSDHNKQQGLRVTLKWYGWAIFKDLVDIQILFCPWCGERLKR